MYKIPLPEEGKRTATRIKIQTKRVEEMGKYAFGVDVGGTTVKLGLFDMDGCVEEIKNATMEQLLEIPEMNERTAGEIVAFFQK